MVNKQVGVLGATSFVGNCLLPLLTNSGWQVNALSRLRIEQSVHGVTWWQLPSTRHFSPPPLYCQTSNGVIPNWICVAPIWVLPEYFTLLKNQGARRLVVLSSTSRFTKDDSSDVGERTISIQLAKAEALVQEWAENHKVEWVILRPTMIYGLGQDKNISEIANFIHNFGFFPLFGNASGLRQPVHVQDVASVCVAALQLPSLANRAYNFSGGETLTYRDMVERIFIALAIRPRILTLPLWIFGLAVTMMRCLPRYRQWSTAMAIRMNQDLVFDPADVKRDFGFTPRQFSLKIDDLPCK